MATTTISRSNSPDEVTLYSVFNEDDASYQVATPPTCTKKIPDVECRCEQVIPFDNQAAFMSQLPPLGSRVSQNWPGSIPLPSPTLTYTQGANSHVVTARGEADYNCELHYLPTEGKLCPLDEYRGSKVKSKYLLENPISGDYRFATLSSDSSFLPIRWTRWQLVNTIYDRTGKPLQVSKIDAHSINVSTLIDYRICEMAGSGETTSVTCLFNQRLSTTATMSGVKTFCQIIHPQKQLTVDKYTVSLDTKLSVNQCLGISKLSAEDQQKIRQVAITNGICPDDQVLPGSIIFYCSLN